MTTVKPIPESKIENYLKKRVEKIGGKCFKMIPTYNNGMPDRQVLYKGRVIFVEVKKATKTPRKLQAVFMKELNKNGFETRVIDCKEEVDELINDLQNA